MKKTLIALALALVTAGLSAAHAQTVVKIGHAGPLTEMIALANLAVRAGRPLDLDPATGAVKTAGIPNEWVTPQYRNGWAL